MRVVDIFCSFDTGQISGFLEMEDFLRRFHSSGDSPDTYAFSDVRSGTIVGLLSIGTLIGALGSAPIADAFGRRICIVSDHLDELGTSLISTTRSSFVLSFVLA